MHPARRRSYLAVALAAPALIGSALLATLPAPAHAADRPSDGSALATLPMVTAQPLSARPGPVRIHRTDRPSADTTVKPTDRRASQLPPQRSTPVGGPRRSAASVALPAASATSLGLPCPVGTVRVNQYAESFESGSLPDTGETKAWSVATGDGAHGQHYATSTVAAGATLDVKAPDGLYLPLLTKGAGRTVLSFAVRGSYGPDTAMLGLNDSGGVLSPSPTWGQVTLDITDTIPAGEDIDIAFFNLPGSPVSADSRVDIDDIQIYRCVPVKATGVAGDFNGDTRPDLLTIDAGGRLLLHPGTGKGSFGDPQVVATRWGGISWLGSVGDVTGDGRPDLLARTKAGGLTFYAGKGMGAFTGTPISRGWNAFAQLAVLGDIDGDQLVDLVARDSRAHLLRYSLAKGGRKIALRNDYGRGWGTYRRVWSTGDRTGDRRADLLLTQRDNSVVLLASKGNGSFARATPLGNVRGLAAYGGAGDLDRNGYGDAWAVLPDGTVRSYLGAAGRWLGTVSSPPTRLSPSTVIMGNS